MEFDLQGADAKSAYKLLTSLVTPRPIAWITTQDSDGNVNAAPFSFFNVFGTRPPIVAFAPGDKEPGIPKDTARNIRSNQEFVVNLVDEAVAEAMNATAADLPFGQSEITFAGLTLAPSATVAPPRIAESPVSMECTEHSTIEIGRDRIVLGIISRLHVRDGIIDPETVNLNPDSYFPIGRMQSPDSYCRTRDQFEIERPD